MQKRNHDIPQAKEIGINSLDALNELILNTIWRNSVPEGRFHLAQPHQKRWEDFGI